MLNDPFLVDPEGTVRQGLLAEDPGFRRGRQEHYAPVRGQVVNVLPAESPQHRGGVVLVDVLIGGLYAATLRGVPVLSPRASLTDGEAWTPALGDLVLVAFVEGRYRDPVVLGCFQRAGNSLEGAAGELPRYRRSVNGTTETITKTGRRVIHVAEDEEVEIVGDGSVSVGGGLTVTVTGAATVLCNQIQLGATAGLQRLIDERFAALFDAHTHLLDTPHNATLPPVVPMTPVLATVSTAKTKAV